MSRRWSQRGRVPPQTAPVTLQIDRLSHEGRGVGRVDGKTVFVEGALPGERVVARHTRRRGQFDEAKVEEIITASPDRVVPRCAHAAVCGGCSLQHLSSDAQLAHKERVLLELLEHQAQCAPARLLPALRGPLWGYRRKARLGVKQVTRKGGVLIGFHEKASTLIADIARCEVLDPAVGLRLTELRTLVEQLSIPNQIPQLEVAIGEGVRAVVVRHLQAFTPADLELLQRFERISGLTIYLQPKGPDTIRTLAGDAGPLHYRVGQTLIEFLPNDFAQVNAEINERMVERVLAELDPNATETVLDLFCGLGNFSLELARRAEMVVGLDAEGGLITRAQANAAANGIVNAQFLLADLFTPAGVARIPATRYEKVLLDPPRSGAELVVKTLDLRAAQRLVYVSCNPVTLARDTADLLRQGFTLAAAGVMDMFPHTAHVESLAVFTRR